MHYFWTTQEHIPSGLGFSLYGLSHLLCLSCVIVICIAGVLLYRRLSPNGKHRLLCILGWSMAGLELCKDVFLLVTGQFRLGYLPLDLCGMSIFLEIAAVYIPKPHLTELIYSLSMPGAVLALLFPNWNSLPIWSYMSLHSFTLHTLLLLIPVLMLVSRTIRPSIRRLPFCFTCIAAMSVPVALVNRCFGTNFFFLARPSKGSPLVWFEQVFGNHLIGLPVLMAMIWTGMYGLPALLRCVKKISKH